MIAAIVLAAGFARRMGRQKLLLELRGKPVVRWSVEAILPYVGDTVVVTGQDDQAVRAALDGLPVRFAVNPRPQAGQGLFSWPQNETGISTERRCSTAGTSAHP